MKHLLPTDAVLEAVIKQKDFRTGDVFVKGHRDKQQQFVQMLIDRNVQDKVIKKRLSLFKLKASAFPVYFERRQKATLRFLVYSKEYEQALQFVESSEALKLYACRMIIRHAGPNDPATKQFIFRAGLAEQFLEVDTSAEDGKSFEDNDDMAPLDSCLSLAETIGEDNIIFVDTPAALQACVDHLMTQPAIGFDSEWKAVHISSNAEDTPAKCALVQLASREKAFVVDVLALYEHGNLLAPLFQSDSVLKLGFDTRGDVKALRPFLSGGYTTEHVMSMLVDLQAVTKKLPVVKSVAASKERAQPGDAEAKDSNSSANSSAANSEVSGSDSTPRRWANKRSKTGKEAAPAKSSRLGLTAIAETYLGLPLDKRARMSDWERRPLTPAQLQYAALDAHVLVQLFDKMQEQHPADEFQAALKRCTQKHVNISAMHATWRGLELADAAGALTPEGARLLEQELGDERLVVATLLGPPSTRAARRELAAALLGLEVAAPAPAGDGALVLLASAARADEDSTLLLLDADADGLQQLSGALCALSSLVLSSYDEIGSTQSLAPALPQFQTLFQTLARDYAAMEVYELLPKMLSLDWSPGRSLADKLADADKERADASVEALESLVRFKTAGVLYPRSVAPMSFDDFCGAHATVKRLFGLEMTGDMLSALMRKLSQQLQQQDPLDFGTAWDNYVEDTCRVLAEDALNTYVDCVHPSVLEHPPMELDAFKQLHDEIWRLSMDVYHAASKYRSSRHRTVRNKLKDDIRAHYETELGVLTQKSREYCEELRQALWAELLAHATHTRDDSTFAAMLAAIQNFDKQFNEKARGPEKAAVLRDFYQNEAIQAFQQLENVVTQQLSEFHLEGLRQQLEKDFADKKEALVEHFKQEEAQLRAGMARDMETMQKMHEAKAARVKIDGSETKRLRDELSELKRQNVELQEKAIVLEHSQQDAVNQKAVLATKVDELELAVRREMANRTELVETLALTIKNAEEKETTLNDKIAELQLELGEKTFRVEGELQDLTQQLRKTNELNEFFLKVTALPEALQQHLFCMENDGQVDFADALTSYMSQ
ncbi:unnamed protein product [Phytophthora fragariaefolia]|uniref:Unnamed protein product n=1 Tax=Phytophthora fragariaefolia TaxID=1490495 RepID=A0A9W6WSG3_9STRA|nr:unnamed protein product [Phytophthora fragariaefolia]